jgi:hypothetical protein
MARQWLFEMYFLGTLCLIFILAEKYFYLAIIHEIIGYFMCL